MTIEQPPSPDDDAPLDRCFIGECHRANACAFTPCRAPREHPNSGIGALALVVAAGLAGWMWL